jgi:hypothetical protein
VPFAFGQNGGPCGACEQTRVYCSSALVTVRVRDASQRLIPAALKDSITTLRPRTHLRLVLALKYDGGLEVNVVRHGSGTECSVCVDAFVRSAAQACTGGGRRAVSSLVAGHEHCSPRGPSIIARGEVIQNEHRLDATSRPQGHRWIVPTERKSSHDM